MTLYGHKQNTFEIKQGDTSPRIETVLLDANGPIDLTSATAVKFSATLRANPRTPLLAEVSASFVADTSGRVWYDWVAGNTNTPGIYDIEWTVIYPGGKRGTVPSKGFDTLEITASL